MKTQPGDIGEECDTHAHAHERGHQGKKGVWRKGMIISDRVTNIKANGTRDKKKKKGRGASRNTRKNSHTI